MVFTTASSSNQHARYDCSQEAYCSSRLCHLGCYFCLHNLLIDNEHNVSKQCSFAAAYAAAAHWNLFTYGLFWFWCFKLRITKVSWAELCRVSILGPWKLAVRDFSKSQHSWFWARNFIVVNGPHNNHSTSSERFPVLQQGNWKVA